MCGLNCQPGLPHPARSGQGHKSGGREKTGNFHQLFLAANEACQGHWKIRPANLGQAGRISGINPADLTVLMIYLDDKHAAPV